MHGANDQGLQGRWFMKSWSKDSRHYIPLSFTWKNASGFYRLHYPQSPFRSYRCCRPSKLPILEDIRCFFDNPMDWIHPTESRRIKFRLKPMFQLLGVLYVYSRRLNAPIFFAQKQKYFEVLICHPNGMAKISLACVSLRRNCRNTTSKPHCFHADRKKIYLCWTRTYIKL
jgi:hypothetical protein